MSENAEKRKGKERFEALWISFNQRYPGEKECFDEIVERASALGLIKCSRCGARDLVLIGNRTVKCNECRKHNFFLASTIFCRMRKSRPWLAAIWFMERGVVLSSSKMHELLGVAQSTAWVILRKLASLKELLLGTNVLLCTGIELSSIISKRSRETPARQHPRAEILQWDVNVPEAISSITVIETEDVPLSLIASTEQADGDEEVVKKMLSVEPSGFDNLVDKTGLPVSRLSAALTILELTGKASRISGDRYLLSERSSVTKVSSTETSAAKSPIELVLMTKFLSWIRKTYHGVSLKYLQTYMACFSFVIGEKFMPGEFLSSCLRAAPMTYADLIEYVSGLVLSLPFGGSGL